MSRLWPRHDKRCLSFFKIAVLPFQEAGEDLYIPPLKWKAWILAEAKGEGLSAVESHPYVDEEKRYFGRVTRKEIFQLCLTLV